MATYPSIGKRTTVRALNDRKTDISDAGGVRIVDLSAAQVYEVKVEHPLINSTDLATLRTFWSTNKNAANSITAGDGYTYSGYFVNEPEVDVINGSWATARVTIVGSRL
jgi:hypothetical protein